MAVDVLLKEELDDGVMDTLRIRQGLHRPQLCFRILPWIKTHLTLGFFPSR